MPRDRQEIEVKPVFGKSRNATLDYFYIHDCQKIELKPVFGKSSLYIYIFRNATRDYFYIHDRQKIEVGPNINSRNVTQLSNMIRQFFLKKIAD